jgi:hypothetical protein
MEVSRQLHAPVALRRERFYGTHLIEGWVDLEAGLDVVGKRKILSSAGNLEESRPSLI